jgi:hypothetical protein
MKVGLAERLSVHGVWGAIEINEWINKKDTKGPPEDIKPTVKNSALQMQYKYC